MRPTPHWLGVTIRRNIAITAVVWLTVLACGLPGAADGGGALTPPPALAATQTMPTLGATATIEVMSVEGLKNMPYVLPVSGRNVILIDGAYEGGSGGDYVLANLGQEIAFGDLDGDGLEDAAVTLAENMGGSGVFVSLVTVFHGDGVRLQGAHMMLGDRVIVSALDIQEGQIEVSLLRHAEDDPLCCPTIAARQRYIVTPGGLILTHVVSLTRSGEEIEISIEEPQPEETLPAVMQVKGSVTIAPFENTLVYRLQDEAGALLAEGALMVRSEDLGAPGTFDATVDLSSVQPGSSFWLTVNDLSMVDGAIVAMDAVALRRE